MRQHLSTQPHHTERSPRARTGDATAQVGSSLEGSDGAAEHLPASSDNIQTMLKLQSLIGNSALQRLLAQPDARAPAGAVQRDESDKEGDTQSSGLLSMRGHQSPKASLMSALEKNGRPNLASLIADKRAITPPFDVPHMLSKASKPTIIPFQQAYGPFKGEEALQVFSYAGQNQGDLMETIKADPEGKTWDLWLIYENDGTGIFPNFGSGSDQGRTAAFSVLAHFNKESTGFSRLGLTVIDMTTPQGKLPPGAPDSNESMYETADAPYSGVFAVDFGVTVARTGNLSIDFISSVGIDSQVWGKVVQDVIHGLTDRPRFPWPKETKPLVEGGVEIKYTINDLVNRELFKGLSYTGRLELDAKAITGTRRTEGTLGAKFIMRTSTVHVGSTPIWVEYSPIGAFVRGFVRYNDGRQEPLAGIEGGANSSIMLNIGSLGVGIAGEAVVSTDPAFQTNNPAGSHPAALQHGMPAGHHGTGKVFIKMDF